MSATRLPRRHRVVSPYKTVQHTPEQTGGFSDADLIGIFQMGVVPKAARFDTTIVSLLPMWQSASTEVDVGDSAKGLVVTSAR